MEDKAGFAQLYKTEREKGSHIEMGAPVSWIQQPRPYLRFDWPRDALRTVCFAEPRGTVRFGFGAAFLRAARFSFFRSSTLSMLLVFAIGFLFS